MKLLLLPPLDVVYVCVCVLVRVRVRVRMLLRTCSMINRLQAGEASYGYVPPRFSVAPQ